MIFDKHLALFEGDEMVNAVFIAESDLVDAFMPERIPLPSLFK